MHKYKVIDLVLTHGTKLPDHAVSNVESRKLLPRFIGTFKVLKCSKDAYELDILTSMRLHPTFYVGRLKPYLPGGLADLLAVTVSINSLLKTADLFSKTIQLGRLNLTLSAEPLKNVNPITLHGFQRNDTSFVLAED